MVWDVREDPTALRWEGERAMSVADMWGEECRELLREGKVRNLKS